MTKSLITTLFLRLQEAGAEAHTNTFYRQEKLLIDQLSLKIFNNISFFPRHYYFFMKEHHLMEVHINLQMMS